MRTSETERNRQLDFFKDMYRGSGDTSCWALSAQDKFLFIFSVTIASQDK